MGRFFKSPSKYWDEDEEEKDLFGDSPEDVLEEDEEVDEEDEEEILQAIRRGEYKPKRSDPWTWHVLYATNRDLESLSKNTHDLSSQRSKSKRHQE